MTARAACAAMPAARKGLAIGKITSTVAKPGWIRLAAKITARSRVRLAIDGYRVSRWLRLKTVAVKRTALLKADIRDRGYYGFRLRLAQSKAKWLTCRFAGPPSAR